MWPKLRTHPATAGLQEEERPRPGDGTRTDGDDFYCLRFKVWYRSVDCAFRTRFRTCAACADCDQGRFNLKRHAAELRDQRSALRLLAR